MKAHPALHPSLENGDRLSQQEFHRRYELHPELHHVELVEGGVYLPSPICFQQHGKPQAIILGWLTTYASKHPGVEVSGPGTVILDGENEPEPDAMMYFEPGPASPVKIVHPGYIAGAPELVVEISGSSASIDLGDKLRAYQRNGVREYIVWSTLEGQLRWFVLRNGVFEPLVADDNGIIHSTVFEGLRLNVERLLAGDLAAVLDTQIAALR